jgi:hypothetical protein
VTLNIAAQPSRPILRLLGIEDVAGGRKIEFSGFSGVSYAIQVSDDLVTWTLLGTQTADSSGL